ncbi:MULTISPECIES: EF-P beta-lysylation protein EpmB [Methylomicrobium]|uniref:L-lysine 2,3-aminomutase n=1 Tax=Methylomicrobium album BG8 TaxID=686340 RepID=H8GKK6_METAL|nr:MULTISPECIES: EF-P beta-lysylation protein EpmB [Methylomicrobium]EIC28014.1 lysine-2,3-aminomutase-related protein [Methylomicrobium album BG8]
MPELNEQTDHFAKNWQRQLAEAFTDIDEFCAYLNLSVEQLPVSKAAAKSFALKVPRSFAEAIEKGNPHDPLLRQVLPIRDEMLFFPGYSDNPVGDLEASNAAGVLHKYRGRVLLINTGSCAINCRYCFRRSFPYADLQLGKEKEIAALRYIRENPDITEVILSGGDPLLLSDERLRRLFRQIAGIAHVKRVRIHSRLPIVLPARITQSLLEVLSQSAKPVVLVVHCNHSNELTDRVAEACRPLKQKGMILLNQSVLLRGVNDKAADLVALSERLFDCGIMPYYLHLLDKVSGAGHFEVGEAEALELVRRMSAELPGYLVPKLVKEIAGADSKQRIL